MILVMTPLAAELNILKSCGLDRERFYLSQGGHGKVEFALRALTEIQKVKPTLFICAGAAGALNPSYAPRDLILGQETLEHDFQLKFVRRPTPCFPADAKVLQSMLKQVDRFDFQVHVGKIASGDEDIINPERAAELRRLTGADAVAWEGAGGARAARLTNTAFIEIRMISDTAGTDAADRFRENLEPGMKNLAAFLREWPYGCGL